MGTQTGESCGSIRGAKSECTTSKCQQWKLVIKRGKITKGISDAWDKGRKHISTALAEQQKIPEKLKFTPFQCQCNMVDIIEMGKRFCMMIRSSEIRWTRHATLKPEYEADIQIFKEVLKRDAEQILFTTRK
ncbi:hypothetical protein Anapl_14878 [Anas platyrhynchos]|uniref:Uncharacterized protein n=1 Tax=Anas platyrhynchos TaxID=8839 RepID=R0KB57_ANAPL|nr:hypothetical protein Anapl_14878 [Anas platyrhynchos]